MAFGGAGPEWLQAIVGLGYLFFAVSHALPSGDREPMKPKPVERDRPPPY